MTKEKMRIKDVGATINLGNYSSLHVTIGEPSEFAGLELQRATNYLKGIAEKVGGVLALPEMKQKSSKKEEKVALLGEKLFSFGSDTPIFYDNDTHTYTTENGVVYESVTQMLSTFYPRNGGIAQEYMDFAASFGNLVHTAIQNSVIGKKPKKQMVANVVDKAMEAIGDYEEAFVERLLAYPEAELAGRFDILTKHNNEYTLWDVKTNSNLFMQIACTLPEPLKEQFGKFWKVDSIYGEHCLQLNLYAFMLEKTAGIKISKLKILHVPDDFEQVVEVPLVDVSSILQAYGASR